MVKTFEHIFWAQQWNILVLDKKGVKILCK